MSTQTEIRPDAISTWTMRALAKQLLAERFPSETPVKVNAREELYQVGKLRVRVRTNRDGNLIGRTANADPQSPMNLEQNGADMLLFVMPGDNDFVAFLVPMLVATASIRQAHAHWLTTNPNTKGSNTTPVIFFNQTEPFNWSELWKEYRIR